MTRTLSLLLSVTVLGGCDYFPEELLDGATESDAGANDAGETFALAETCLGMVPMLTSGLSDVTIDLSTHTDDISDIGFCTGADAPGNDGFFGVEMSAGEKWHFHVRTNAGAALNPAIYVLDSTCDSRRCMAGDAIDVCGEGRDEHLSFVAPQAGTYFVGIDSRLSGGATYQLVAVRPVCGNGEIEHSETCDDNNTEDGDGCDSLCRAEMSSGAAEVEPNDDPTGANRILSLTSTASGVLGGRCDRDLFVVEVESAGDLQVALSGIGGTACVDGDPTFELDLLGPDGRTVVRRGAPAAGEFCPTVNATALAAGVYYLAVTTGEDERPFNYTLTLSQ